MFTGSLGPCGWWLEIHATHHRNQKPWLKHHIEIATRSADASGVQGILRHFSFSWKSESATTRPSWHFPIFQSGNMSQMLGMLEMQGIQTTQRTGTDPIFASNISRLSDTQHLHNTENTRDAGNAGNAAGWPQKSPNNQDLLIFPKINHQKQILATPFKYHKNRLPKTR